MEQTRNVPADAMSSETRQNESSFCYRNDERWPTSIVHQTLRFVEQIGCGGVAGFHTKMAPAARANDVTSFSFRRWLYQGRSFWHVCPEN
jgi:hypothetical protein